MPTTPKQIQTLVTYYINQYEKKYGWKPKVNRNKARWHVENMLLDMSMDEFKELVDYYLSTAGERGHDFDWLVFNYDKLLERKSEIDDDIRAQKLIREQTKRRVEEWRMKRDANRTESN